jgi:chromosome segregation ATPase
MLGLHETGKVLDAIDSTRKSLEKARLKEESASKRVAEAQHELERFQRSLELVVAISIREGYEKALKRLGSHLARTSRTLIHFMPTDNLCAQTASHKHTTKRTSLLHLLHRTRDGATSRTIDAYSGHGPQEGGDGTQGTRTFCS